MNSRALLPPNLPWLALRESDGGTLELVWGEEEEHAGTAHLGGWRELRARCRRTERRRDAVGWTFLAHRAAEEIGAIEMDHAHALTEAWNAIESMLPVRFATERFAAVRGLSLLELPVGALVAAARPSRIVEETLPFDIHPGLGLRGAEFARLLPCLPLPAADRLTLLIAEDLGQGAFLSKPTPYGASMAISSEGLAEMMAFVDWQNRAIDAARTAGVRVVRSFTVEEFAREVLTPRRPFLMIATHLEPRGADTEGGVACSDGLVRLSPLSAALEGCRRNGAPASLAAVDLLLCNAADELAGCFFAGGVLAINSACSLIPSGKLLVLLTRLFERRLLDGTRSFQHAWTMSTLPNDPAKGS